MSLLESQSPGAGGEIQLTDAMLTLLRSRPFRAYPFRGVTYDTGSKLGYLRAFAALALRQDGPDGANRAILQSVLDS
jgi:UTP--glucose-1-phosphate uridylyltransferase